LSTFFEIGETTGNQIDQLIHRSN